MIRGCEHQVNDSFGCDDWFKNTLNQLNHCTDFCVARFAGLKNKPTLGKHHNPDHVRILFTKNHTLYPHFVAADHLCWDVGQTSSGYNHKD
jgi:hypothetical protein